MSVNNPSNPESLHNMADNKSVMTDPKFRNPGTPAAALITESDLVKAEISKEASAKLSENLIK